MIRPLLKTSTNKRAYSVLKLELPGPPSPVRANIVFWDDAATLMCKDVVAAEMLVVVEADLYNRSINTKDDAAIEICCLQGHAHYVARL